MGNKNSTNHLPLIENDNQEIYETVGYSEKESLRSLRNNVRTIYKKTCKVKNRNGHYIMKLGKKEYPIEIMMQNKFEPIYISRVRLNIK